MYAQMALHCWTKRKGEVTAHGPHLRIMPGERIPTKEGIKRLVDKLKGLEAAVAQFAAEGKDAEKAQAQTDADVTKFNIDRYKAVMPFFDSAEGTAAVEHWRNVGALADSPPVPKSPKGMAALVDRAEELKAKRIAKFERRIAEAKSAGQRQKQKAYEEMLADELAED